MTLFEDLNKAIKERYEMIERAVEAERQSQHMSRAFTDRMDEMVEARAAEMTVEEAEAVIEEGTGEESEAVEEAPVEEAPVEEAPVEEAPAEETEAPAEEETPTEEAEAPAEEEAEASSAETWNSDVDPWADN